MAVQSAPQSIPTGTLVTTPLPPPARITVSEFAEAAKYAVAFCAPVIVTGQVNAVPVQAPPQPAKAELAPAAAVSVTTVPNA